MNKKIGILCLCLILMPGLFFAQELDDKIPLLDEPIITPKEELPNEEKIVQPTPPPTIEPEEKTPILPQVGTSTITETIISDEESKEETTTADIGTPTSKEESITPPQTETLTTLGTVTSEGTITPPLGASTPLVDTSNVATSTITSQEGTVTASLGTPTTTSLAGTLTMGTPTLLNTGLILVPTAYRHDDKLGFNTDFIIAYYIGELWHSMNNGEFFEPIKFLFLSGDFKFSLLKEKEQIPHFGAGYEWFLVLTGGASTAAQMGGQFSGKSDRFGYPYLIISKKFKHLKCHLGMMSGEIGKLFNPLSDFAALDSNKAIIWGLDTKLLSRQINIEGISSVGSDAHLLIHTSIEHFLGFDLAFMKMPKGFSVIGYFGIRFTIFPYIKDKK